MKDETTPDPDDQPNAMASKTRDGNGRYSRDLATAQRDAQAAELRAKGMSYRRIGEALGCDGSTAYQAVQRVLKETVEEPAAEVRQLELERLDRAYEAVMAVLEREHVTVSHGKIIQRQVGYERDDFGEIQCDGDGRPIAKYEDLLDDSPVLQAVDRLLRIQARRAALLGLDAPTKAQTGVTISYEILGVDLDQL